MDFNWKSPVLPRVAILAFSILLFGYLFFSEQQYVISIILLLVIIFQVMQFIKIVENSKEDFAAFMDWIKFDDLSSAFKTESKDPDVLRLHREMNDALAKLRYSRQERDSEYLFYKNIVMHVAIGLIIFK